MTAYVGDYVRPTLTVTPFDGTTVAVLTVTDPDGIETTPSVTSSGGGTTWTATSYQLTKAGEWYELWTVTGTGAGARTYTRAVEPQPEPSAPLPGSYANTQDFYDLASPSSRPANLVTLLRRCSRAIDRALLTSIYDQTDAAVVTALKEATVEQAEWAEANGWSEGINAGYHSVQIGSVNLTRGYTGQGSAAVVGQELSPTAFTILQLAGLTGHAPITGG